MRSMITNMYAVSIFAIIALGAACGGDDGGGESAEVKAGRERVEGRLCGTCHGEELSGSSTAYPGTQAFPPNLTPDTETGLGEWTEEEIVAAILDGEADGRQLCNVMPRYRTMGMTEEQAGEIAAYLLSLKAIKKAIPETISCTARGN